MAEASGFKYELTAGNNIPGARRFSSTGVLEPDHMIRVEKAEITQALPPPNGETKIERPKGEWGEVGGDLRVAIEGMYSPKRDQPIEVPFKSEFKFPSKGPLRAGETLKGTGTYSDDGDGGRQVPAELKVL